MRILRTAAVVLGAGLVAGVAVGAQVGVARSSSFATRAALLQKTWTHDLSVGVPASAITPLQTELRARKPQGGWWSPVWWSTDGGGLLGNLETATAGVYAAAMAAARVQAESVLTSWRQEVSTEATWVPSTRAASATQWPAELAAASTPNQVRALTASWQSQLSDTRTEVLAAQQKAEQEQLAADVATAGGPSGLISQASQAVTRAQADNLDPGQVPGLVSQLQGQMASGASTEQTAEQLYLGLQQLNQLFTLNDQLNGEMRPLELMADQAAAEGAPDATTFLAEYASFDTGYLAGRTYAELQPLQDQVTQVQAAIQAELSADTCGHAVGSGKVITISITLQEMVMYDNGCVANATPVTTGRPGFDTPTGTFHVFYKTSPFEMISSYPYGSPGWYPPTWVQRVMEFQWDGYFIHDAYWEAQNAFGPGSENEVAQDYASHGCVHVPNSMMPWLYDWTPLGTTVIISP